MANFDDDDNDSDVGDILGDLLANDSDLEPNDEEPKPILKELDFNFLDDIDESKDNVLPTKDKKHSSIHDNNDSSDDDDKKYFEEQKYSESGRNIRELLKKQEFDRSESSVIRESPTSKASMIKNNSSSWNDIKEKVKNNTFTESLEITRSKTDNSKDTKKKGPLTEWLNKPSDVYTDPVFGLRIFTPLVSSTELKERMRDRAAVTVSKVKKFISTQNMENDWAIAGVLIQRSATKKSQSGNQYCIWTISDLSENVNRVTIFLFKNAYKLFWKTTEGTVVGVLNPNILESRNDKDQATLSVDVAQKIMVLGHSKDMGKCKSRKKNGELCGNIINISKCEYCIYHVKQEYNKASRRPDLQTDVNNRRFGETFGAKPKPSAPGIYSQGNNHNMLAIPAKRNLKMEQKDSDRLAMLMGKKPLPQQSSENTTKESMKSKSSMVELSREQAKKDLDRLNKMRGWSSNKLMLSLPSESNSLAASSSLKPTSIVNTIEKESTSALVIRPIPRLGIGVKGDSIDFSVPIPKKRINSAKLNAINWVKENGGLKNSNPNKIAESRMKIEASSKRRRDVDEEEAAPKPKKISTMSDKFKELMEASSKHTDLIEKSQEDEKEKYFNKLEAKEKMEEKMMNTFKVDCKAVKCLICRYTAFSASDFCKEKKHPLRVIDATKSFFKCSDCGNRTVSLDRIPSQSCKKCSGSNWVRAAMMNEKKMSLPGATLSIRGGEQKFIGSDERDINLDLLVPESTND